MLLQTATPAAAQPLPTLAEVQFTECLDLARKDPASAVTEASLWAQQGGGFLARACQGFALASDFKFDLATPVLREAAQGAQDKRDPRAARFWAQAGNSAIADGKPDIALDALDKALALATLDNKERADSEIDRARALVALDRMADAEKSLGTARQLSPENGTAWLLSATLARRLEKLPDALTYIQTAAPLLPRDPAVALEAGNIAMAAGDEAAARKQWEQTIAIAPASRQANTAQAQLAALGASPPSPADAQSR
ncbi:MAG: tetratricopeptide repeat protein [Sphingomonadaceae bacterium]|nr:tetratricopeptide repeat protein [Sphingomonadaceae bacterium]